MNPRIKLNDIIDCVCFQTNNTVFYLDRESGEIVPVSGEHLRAAEKDGELAEYPEWEKTQIKWVREILADKKKEKYVKIPGKFISHEYSAMENFCISLEDEEVSKPLCGLFRGRSGMRRFKKAIEYLGIAEDWYRYRYHAMKKVVADWCRKNHIEYVDE